MITVLKTKEIDVAIMLTGSLREKNLPKAQFILSSRQTC